jgi:hypothetical protein
MEGAGVTHGVEAWDQPGAAAIAPGSRAPPMMAPGRLAVLPAVPGLVPSWLSSRANRSHPGPRARS